MGLPAVGANQKQWHFSSAFANDVRRTTYDGPLLLFLLLALLGLCALFLGLLFALLNDLGFSRSRRCFTRHCLSRRHLFFLDADDVRHGLVRISQKLDLVALRQI